MSEGRGSRGVLPSPTGRKVVQDVSESKTVGKDTVAHFRKVCRYSLAACSPPFLFLRALLSLLLLLGLTGSMTDDSFSLSFFLSFFSLSLFLSLCLLLAHAAFGQGRLGST